VTTNLAKVLLVDDEPQVLAALSRGLRGIYEVRTATSGAAGLELLAAEPDTAIVMSDMRMPFMNGTTFLVNARQIAPNTVRLLLTGQAEMEDAIAAINEGSIFRFLRKPCSTELMRSTLAAAAEQHRLVIAERELLEQTLRGAVKALCDTLALANPVVFGTATRVKRIASTIASKVGGTEPWQIEVAAMLCELGAVTLPPGVYERRTPGGHLSPREREMIDRVPKVTDELLAAIPRLEAVREIVLHGRTEAPTMTGIPRGAHVLRVAIDFEQLESAGVKPIVAIERLRARGTVYDQAILDALAGIYHEVDTTTLELPIGRLLEGMVFATDLFTKAGALLVARGHEVTPSLLRRLENFATALGQDTITVVADASMEPLRRSAA